MSELKERDARELVINNHYCPSDEGMRVYLKSEADKVIEELKERVREERSMKVDYKISANDLSDGLKKAYEEIDELKGTIAQLEDDAAYWKTKYLDLKNKDAV